MTPSRVENRRIVVLLYFQYGQPLKPCIRVGSRFIGYIARIDPGAARPGDEVAANSFEDFEAIQFGHVHVQHDRIRNALSQRGHRLAPITGDIAFDIGLPEHFH